MGEPRLSGKLSREYMATAILLLMKSKEYSRISINEITEKAGVSRMAFYRNFKSKDDILINYLSEKSKGITDGLSNRYEGSLRDVLTHLGCFIRENLPLVLAVSKTGKIKELLDYLTRISAELFPEVTEDKKSEYLTEFYIGAVVFTFKHWVETGMKEEPEVIADRICEFMGEKAIRKFDGTEEPGE